MQIQVKTFQADFLDSQARFPALIAGIGTGKTYMMLLKIWRFCEQHPDSLALVVRRTYTDLRDSTLKDFERYFNVKISSDKEYHFPNGSIIMFRHGEELNVLKNINLSIAGMEQAEEFPTDDQFNYIRDRLRRTNAPIQQLLVIANACGHNWIWKKWINNPGPEYDVSQATTFENADNLPEAFLNDLKAMEVDAPNHYKQYVMNCHEAVESDDLLLAHDVLIQATRLNYGSLSGTKRRVLAVDVARYGEDETVFTVLESKDVVRWEQIHLDHWRGRSLMEVVGKVLDLYATFKMDITVIDDVGMGGGVTDRLQEGKIVKVMPFSGGDAVEGYQFFNKKSMAYFKLKEMLEKGWLKILPDDEMLNQLLSIRYKYRSDKAKMIVGKEEMRKEGLHSPDRADALMMAAFFTGRALALPRGTQQYQEIADSAYDPLKH